MTRRHKSNYYPSEGLRQLQAQINELWEHLEAVRQAYVKSEDTADAGVFADSVVAHPEEIQAQHNANAWVNELLDSVPPAHDPQPFKVYDCGRGWYRVVDMGGKPIQEGKLRRAQVDKLLRDAWGVGFEDVTVGID